MDLSGKATPWSSALFIHSSKCSRGLQRRVPEVSRRGEGKGSEGCGGRTVCGISAATFETITRELKRTMDLS